MIPTLASLASQMQLAGAGQYSTRLWQQRLALNCCGLPVDAGGRFLTRYPHDSRYPPHRRKEIRRYRILCCNDAGGRHYIDMALARVIDIE
jgi:hypothetical protein